MNHYIKILLAVLILSLYTISVEAATKEKYKNDKDNEVQRQVTGYLDYQFNTLSNIETIISNFGMIGYDKPNNRGTGYWPRGSRNQYIFGGGIWFAARKFVPDPNNPDSTNFNKLVSVSYDPSRGDSWLTPGRIEEDAIRVQNNQKYRVYLSTDFSQNSGEPLSDEIQYNWPLWDDQEEDTLSYSRYFGNYKYNMQDRDAEQYPPAFISGEDIFSTFHDLDISRYLEGTINSNRSKGYPLGIQYDLTIYSWGFGKYQNFMFFRYEVQNMSEDTLWECWLAPIMDVDLARSPFLFSGAGNDRVSYWFEDTLRNMAYQFTDGQFGERGQGFGYLGFDFLESPTIYRPPLLDDNGDTVWTESTYEHPITGELITDTIPVIDKSHPNFGFVRKDSAYYHVTNQIGLTTFRNWSIENDQESDIERYNFLSSGIIEGDTGPGDKRFMMSTGPFNLRPGDTSRTVVGIMIAPTSKGGDADNSLADRQALAELNTFAQEVYDNNFRAPQPPDQAIITEFQGLNNGVTIKWDSTSEISNDREEAGLDFLGYRLERARRHDLDTFATSQIEPNDQYLKGRGPLGWKQIAEWRMPKPFIESSHIVEDETAGTVASIDSMIVVGPVMDNQGNITDTNAVRVMRIGQGTILHNRDLSFSQTNSYAPVIAGIDSSEKPWGEYFYNLASEDFTKSHFDNFLVRYRPNENRALFNEAYVGIVKFDPARVLYNPLFFKQYAFNVSKSYKETVLDSIAVNGVAVRYKLVEVEHPDDPDETVLVESSEVDSVYFVNTGRNLQNNGSTSYIINGALPISDFKTAMRDSNLVRMANDSLYSFIKQNLVNFEFNDFEGSSTVKEDVIMPYMERITNGRTFIDIGDDDRDGELAFSDDITRTEKLINNSPYYYRLLSFDQGDASQPTPEKTNNARFGRNQIETFPEANQVGEELMFEIIEMDSTLLHGLYDFEFFAINKQRAEQLFMGDTLELTFEPSWQFINTTIQRIDNPEFPIQTALYTRNTSLVNLSDDNKLLFNDQIEFNTAGCSPNTTYSNLLVENAALISGTQGPTYQPETGDSVFIGEWNNSEILTRAGTYTTGDFSVRNHCKTPLMRDLAYGTLGFRFKFALQQIGGIYRPDSMYIEEGDATTHTSLFQLQNGNRNINVVQSIQPVTKDTFGLFYNGMEAQASPLTFPSYASFNNGPVDATIEFVGSGEETVTLEWNNNKSDPKESVSADRKQSTFTVPYLEVKVTNNYSYEVFDNQHETVRIKSPEVMPHIDIEPVPSGNEVVRFPTQTGEIGRIELVRNAYPDPRNLPTMNRSTSEFLGKFNIAAFGHVNIENFNTFISKFRSVARPHEGPLREVENTYSGLQGRYYLSGSDGEGNTIDFINVLNIGGAQFVFDYKNIGRRFGNTEQLGWKSAPSEYEPDEDFEVGDKVRVKTNGGAAGLPLPGAKVKVVLKNANESPDNISDENMEDIKVVPNPYYITHVNEQTPYQNKLYFTKVPPGSTIEIYTAHGQLVQTIEHDPFSSDNEEGRVAVNVWDMIMKNGLRVQSQTLVARIIAPNGAETMEKFSVVVGTFNVYDK